MNRRRVALVVFWALAAGCAAHGFYYYGLLPDRVPAHFDAAGMPDGWADKRSLIAGYLGAAALCAALFSLLSFVVERLPATKLSLPDKERLLAPGREGQTRDLMAAAFAWFGAATLVLLLDIFQQSFQVALGAAAGLSHPVLSIGLYLSFGLAGSIWLLARLVKKSG